MGASVCAAVNNEWRALGTAEAPGNCADGSRECAYYCLTVRAPHAAPRWLAARFAPGRR